MDTSLLSDIRVVNVRHKLLSWTEVPENKKKNEGTRKKRLILDLDGTLVAVFSTQPKFQHSTIRVPRGNSKTTLYVSARRGFSRFLQTLNEYYEIQLFTSSVKEVK